MDQNYLKKELYEKFQNDHEIFDFLQEAALDGLWYWDLNQPENEWMSDTFWETLGYDPKEKKPLASEWQAIVFSDDFKNVEKNLKRHLEDPEYPYDQIIRYHHKNGSTVWIRCRGFAIRDENNVPLRMLGAHVDVTDLMTTHNQINRLKNEYKTVFNGTQDALFLIEVRDTHYFRYVRNNRAHRKETGISQSMIEGKTPYQLLGEEAGNEVVAHYQKCVDERDVISYEEALDLPSGKRLWHTTLTPIIENGTIKHIVGSAVDITEQKRLEKALEFRANYDALTQLANRDYLTRKIEYFSDDASLQFVFIFIDLNDFKPINDRHGHLAGDRVLKATADRLKELTDEDDLVARLGGDEFVILKYDIDNAKTIEAFNERLAKTLRKPIDYEGQAVSVSASIGYARFPSDGRDYDQLAYKADKAMYRMKNKGRQE